MAPANPTFQPTLPCNFPPYRLRYLRLNCWRSGWQNMAFSKSSIFCGRAGAAIIAVLSCAVAVLSCNATATTAGRCKVAATFTSLSQAAAAPLPRIASAWNHWHQMLSCRALGQLYQLGRMYKQRRPAQSMNIMPAMGCPRPVLPGQCNSHRPQAHRVPLHRTLSRTLAFVRCRSLLPPPRIV